MSDELNFDKKMYGVEARLSGDPHVFNAAVNAESEKEALDKAVDLMRKEGLNPILIAEMNTCELGKPDGE